MGKKKRGETLDFGLNLTKYNLPAVFFYVVIVRVYGMVYRCDLRAMDVAFTSTLIKQSAFSFIGPDFCVAPMQTLLWR